MITVDHRGSGWSGSSVVAESCGQPSRVDRSRRRPHQSTSHGIVSHGAFARPNLIHVSVTLLVDVRQAILHPGNRVCGRATIHPESEDREAAQRKGQRYREQTAYPGGREVGMREATHRQGPGTVAPRWWWPPRPSLEPYLGAARRGQVASVRATGSTGRRRCLTYPVA